MHNKPRISYFTFCVWIFQLIIIINSSLLLVEVKFWEFFLFPILFTLFQPLLLQHAAIAVINCVSTSRLDNCCAVAMAFIVEQIGCGRSVVRVAALPPPQNGCLHPQHTHTRYNLICGYPANMIDRTNRHGTLWWTQNGRH